MNKVLKYGISAILSFFAVISSFGQRREFADAKRKNTIDSYANFIYRFPNHKLTEKARSNKLELCDERGAELLEPDYELDFSDISYFHEKCKESKYNNRIIAKREELTWNLYNEIYKKKLERFSKYSVERADHRRQLSSFIEEYPDSEWNDEAYTRIELLDFFSALEKDTKASVEGFLKAYPKSRFEKTANELLIEFEKHKFIRAVRKAELEKVRLLVKNESKESKSRALMHAVWGALNTYFDASYDAYGNFQNKSLRSSKVPRESYIRVINLLLSNGADPERYKFRNFGSVEVRLYEQRHTAKSYGGGEETYTLTSEKAKIDLVPFKSEGLSIRQVAVIHEAVDILKLLKEHKN